MELKIRASQVGKVNLFDADSLVYQAMYRVVSFSELREMINKGLMRFEIEDEILERGYDRFEKMAFDIINEIESTFQISETRFFFTKCSNSFRKKLDHTYKQNRKSNKWVGKLRDYLLEHLDGSFASDEYEADDLIYFNTQLMDETQYIVTSIDKDLKQIQGWHFDYYQVKEKDFEGNYIFDTFGKEVKTRKGFIYVTKEDSENLLFKMMLTGDNSDNIKGVYGIGEKKADKLLKDKNTYGKIKVVCSEYKKQYGEIWKEKVRLNKSLLVFQ